MSINNGNNDLSYESESENFMKLTWHCLKKGIQIGSVVGFALVGPIISFRRSRANNPISSLEFAKYQLYSIIFGVSASLIMMTAKYISWQNKKECLRDRAYRIDRNQNQNRVD